MSIIINPPENPIDNYFAYNGDFTPIPTKIEIDEESPINPDKTRARASLEYGFPPITEKPLIEGGIPPSRRDINGILRQLSEYVLWAQIGGQYKWSDKQNYQPPAIVFHLGKFYKSINPSGDALTIGPHEPGNPLDNELFWKEFGEFDPKACQEIIDKNLDPVKSDISSIHDYITNEIENGLKEELKNHIDDYEKLKDDVSEVLTSISGDAPNDPDDPNQQSNSIAAIIKKLQDRVYMLEIDTTIGEKNQEALSYIDIQGVTDSNEVTTKYEAKNQKDKLTFKAGGGLYIEYDKNKNEILFTTEKAKLNLPYDPLTYIKPEEPRPKPYQLIIATPPKEMQCVGFTYGLNYTVLYEDGSHSSRDQLIKWTVDKPDLITITDEGIIKYFDEGEVTITATLVGYKDISTSITVNITMPNYQAISPSSVIDQALLNSTIVNLKEELFNSYESVLNNAQIDIKRNADNITKNTNDIMLLQHYVDDINDLDERVKKLEKYDFSKIYTPANLKPGSNVSFTQVGSITYISSKDTDTIYDDSQIRTALIQAQIDINNLKNNTNQFDNTEIQNKITDLQTRLNTVMNSYITAQTVEDKYVGKKDIIFSDFSNMSIEEISELL